VDEHEAVRPSGRLVRGVTVDRERPAADRDAGSAGGLYQGRSLRLAELDDETLRLWASLEDRVLEPNAFLSPRFVIPALRHLESPRAAARARLVFVERRGAGRAEMVAAGVFVPVLSGRRFPLPHLKAYRSPHSYLTGILLDREFAEPAATTLFALLRRQPWTGHGVEFEDWPADAPARLVVVAAARCHAEWWESWRSHRAILVPVAAGDAYLAARLSRSRAKSLRRSRRRLEKVGRVDWRCLKGHEVDKRCIETFLRLEHGGWKARRGSSLLSSAQHATFFRDMTDGFGAEGRLFFTELLVDGNVIASTSHFVSGGVGFSFKIGWDTRYAGMTPGYLSEVELVRQAPLHCADLKFIDSGTSPGSFIEELWGDRRPLAAGVFATTALGRLVARAMGGLRGVRDRAWRRDRPTLRFRPDRPCS
jgi:CelD/BcsL family acetyltransferase involved in cellulose biosynthesis